MKLIKSHTAVRDRSLFIAWGGGGSDHLILRSTQKGVSLKTLEGFKRGTTQIFLENEDIKRGGGDHEIHQMLLGRITSVK